MKLYKIASGILLELNEQYFLIQEDWDVLINRDHLYDFISCQTGQWKLITKESFKSLLGQGIHATIGKQELWAAGVTYLRSRDARMEESQGSGGADCYQKVYEAERPELFFKALPHRIAAHEEKVFIRKDSKWNVPEPELALYINSNGTIQGYSIANDMSSRDIEGENPLYLPQAKIYERSAALGPCLFVPEKPVSEKTMISISIERGKKEIFKDTILLSRMKRSFEELVEFLYRECGFEYGCYLMTGTGMIPPADFTLLPDDRIAIAIEGIGTLVNYVGQRRIEMK